MNSGFPMGDNYWSKPPDADALPRTYWHDPLIDIPGAVLRSDAIEFYCDEFGLIRPFDAKHRRPAAYTLTLGPEAVVDGKLDTTENDIVIPSGGSAIVAPAEVLIVPHYLVGRVGVTVGLTQRGLLLGVGLQVDPGYQGSLRCPLYNLGPHAQTLRAGDKLAHIEFFHTTPLAAEDRVSLSQIPDKAEDKLYFQVAAAREDHENDGADTHKERRLGGLADNDVVLLSREPPRRWLDPFAAERNATEDPPPTARDRG